MIKITVHGRDPSAIMEIIRELRGKGYLQGKDFDFSYHPPGYDNDGWTPVTPKHTVFVFYKDSLATFFALKYGTDNGIHNNH